MPLQAVQWAGAINFSSAGQQVAAGPVVVGVSQGNGVPGASMAGAGTPNTSAPTVATPAVPATTVTAQNANAFPVNVTITGGTLTAVVVNGVTVGSVAGTYQVPAFGAISITYSVAPTWAWSNLPYPATAAIAGGIVPQAVATAS